MSTGGGPLQKLVAIRHRFSNNTPPTSLWERAAEDHPDGVVPRVGDVDVPPGVDTDGKGVVELRRCGGTFVA